MNIRVSNTNDLGSILTLHTDAFGEHEGEVIAKLVQDLLNDGSAEPLLSLVVVEDENIIGHVIFSPVTIQGYENVSAYILAPLAISENRQKLGLGTLLINKGSDELRSRGVEAVFVYGDPNYYKRFGFEAGHNVAAPYELKHPEAWMALELKKGVLYELKGVARCCSSLMSREYW